MLLAGLIRILRSRKVLADGNVEHIIQGDVDTLKALLLDHVCPDTRNIEDVQINAMSKMEILGQKEDEDENLEGILSACFGLALCGWC